MDAIGTAEVETSGVYGFAPRAFSYTLLVVSETVITGTPSAAAMALTLFPSLCSSIIAASRFSFSCTERAGGDLGGAQICYVSIFADSAVLPRRLQVVLGSSSGFCPKAIFRNLKEGPRATGGFASRAFSPLTKTDLGVPKVCSPVWGPPDGPWGCPKAIGTFGTTSGQTSGVTFPLIGILRPLQTNLGVSKGESTVWTRLGRPRGLLNVVTAFRNPSRPPSGFPCA